MESERYADVDLRPYFKRLDQLGLEENGAKKWIEIGSTLSNAKWPEALGEPPCRWETGSIGDKISMMWPIVDYISKVYGFKAICRREKELAGMTGTEFEDYFASKRDTYHQRREADIIRGQKELRKLVIIAIVGACVNFVLLLVHLLMFC